MKILILILSVLLGSCAIGYNIKQYDIQDYKIVVNDRTIKDYYVADITIYQGMRKKVKYTGVEFSQPVDKELAAKEALAAYLKVKNEQDRLKK